MSDCNSNFAFCNTCRASVAAERVQRGNQVFLLKRCAQCGETETLISNNAAAYHNKNQFMAIGQKEECHLNCFGCHHKVPNIAFVEITNRCNMNCPICITNVPTMGFEFEPDREYFRLIFEHLSKLPGPPSVQLFGGEPTVREDLFDIIKMARSYGLSVRVTTNGLKLADPEYCRRLMEEEITVLISVDGFDRKSYELLRGMPGALELKMKALENLGKLKRGKVIIMTVASKEQDVEGLRQLFEYSLKHQPVVRGIFMMPLAHMWSSERLDYNPERTTPEDVEELVSRVVGGGAEFVPMGSLELAPIYKTVKWRNAPFLGVHPNCESITALISDGERFHPISAFLKHGLFAVVDDLRKASKAITASRCSERMLKLRSSAALIRALFKHFDFGAAVGKRGAGALFAWMRIFGKALMGKRLKDVIRAETKLKRALQVMILPFEDYDTTEGERLKMCTSTFVYPEGPSNSIRYVPVCAWERHKKVLMKHVAERFNKPGFTKGLSKESHVATTN
ncbi:MAG: radical SAM protein [Verrucomicrobia bacterium]|nr:radical SAM protein [Verrucomicrobiota bacterium]